MGVSVHRSVSADDEVGILLRSHLEVEDAEEAGGHRVEVEEAESGDRICPRWKEAEEEAAGQTEGGFSGAG